MRVADLPLKTVFNILADSHPRLGRQEINDAAGAVTIDAGATTPASSPTVQTMTTGEVVSMFHVPYDEFLWQGQDCHCRAGQMRLAPIPPCSTFVQYRQQDVAAVTPLMGSIRLASGMKLTPSGSTSVHGEALRTHQKGSLV